MLRTFRHELLGFVHQLSFVAPGKHDVRLAYFKEKLEVEMTAGDDLFVRFDVDPALFGRGFYPVLVARPTAQAELYEHTGTDFSCVKD